VKPITAQPPRSLDGPGAPVQRRGTVPIAPSFEIRGADATGSAAIGALRLDRINSADLLRRSRRIYFHFLESCPTAPEPMGVVLLAEGPQGRVVFEAPVLLPEEQFVPLELLRPRPGRGRGGRGPLNRPQP
jgi:hypothetical protein